MGDESTPRLLRLKQVREIVGLGHSEVYRRMSSGTFPSSVKIGPKAVRWVEGEIREWVSALPRTNPQT